MGVAGEEAGRGGPGQSCTAHLAAACQGKDGAGRGWAALEALGARGWAAGKPATFLAIFDICCLQMCKWLPRAKQAPALRLLGDQQHWGKAKGAMGWAWGGSSPPVLLSAARPPASGAAPCMGLLGAGVPVNPTGPGVSGGECWCGPGGLAFRQLKALPENPPAVLGAARFCRENGKSEGRRTRKKDRRTMKGRERRMPGSVERRVGIGLQEMYRRARQQTAG